MADETLRPPHKLSRRESFPVIAGGLIAVVAALKSYDKPSVNAEEGSGTLPPAPAPKDQSYLAAINKDASAETTVVTESELNKYSEAISKGVEFLSNRFNKDLGLLSASPIVEKDTYWLTNDNKLATIALNAAGQRADLAFILEQSIAANGNPTHGVIEVLNETDESINWPLYGDKKVVNTLTASGEEICFDTRMPPKEGDTEDTRTPMDDWKEYADLAFYGVIDLHKKSESTKDKNVKDKLLQDAKDLYAKTMEKFDENGFADKAFNSTDNEKKQYTTYKLALSIIAGVALDEEIKQEIIDRLLLSQAIDDVNQSLGGFTTLSTAEIARDGDANVETTSLALIALSKLRAKRMQALQTAQKSLTSTTP